MVGTYLQVTLMHLWILLPLFMSLVTYTACISTNGLQARCSEASARSSGRKMSGLVQ